MNKAKLVHITSSLRVGGAEHILFTLVKQLSKQFDQTVIYFHEGPFVQKIAHLGIKTVQIKGLIFFYDPVFFWRLIKTIKQEQPAIVHSLLWAANVSARLCAWLLHIPLVCVYHNNIDQDGYIRSFFDRITLSLPNKIVAVSDQVYRSLIERSPWLSAQRILVITNGIDIDELHKKNQIITRERLGISDYGFIIGSVGRFIREKRYDLLLHACAPILHDYTHTNLLLIGYGPEEQRLRSLAKRLAISNRVLFMIGKTAVPFYPLIDCFVQSSDKEGISIALLEAMSFATVCIVMGDQREHPVIKHNKNGFVVKRGDKNELTDSLLYLMHNHKHKNALGIDAQITVRTMYQMQGMIHKYKKLFDELASK